MGATGEVLSVDEPAVGNVEAHGGQVVGRGAEDAGLDGLPTGGYFAEDATRGHDVGGEVADLCERQRVSVVEAERGFLRRLVLHFTRQRHPAHVEDVDAQLLDLLERFLAGTLSDRNHRDHRGYAEDHPQHRQQRAELVAPELPEAGLDRRGQRP